MKSLILTTALRRAAERCVWFESPEMAIRHTPNLVAHILTFGAIEDVNALRAQYTDEDLKEALEAAPPGIFDARSWAYWNLVVGHYAPPPLPARQFG